jgi:hypothetical protein
MFKLFPSLSSCFILLQSIPSSTIFLFDIIPEGDAMQIVTSISTYLFNWSRFGHFIEKIKEEVMSLWSFRVVHTRREANSVAHTLAKAASAQIKDSIWLEKVLSFISDIVCRELVVLTFLPLRVFFSGLLMGSDFYGSKKKKKK